LKIRVTVRFVVKLFTVQTCPDTASQFPQLVNVKPLLAVAVIVTVVPLAKLAVHVLAQVRPEGELVVLPDPGPGKLTVRAGPPPPEAVKQTTFAVMLPVTKAPDEGRLPAL
jgi:hypothetical protein